MLFPIKSESEMLTEILQDVRKNTSITNLNPGSVARSLVEIFNKRLSSSYRYLDLYTAMSFLSTAEGIYLDMIGGLLSCARLAGESDTNYRYRISNQVFTAAAANRTALRLKCLAVAKVKDIILTPYTRGNGSFTVHVITDEVDTPNDVLAAVSSVVSETKAEGIRAIVAKPKVLPIDVTYNVIVKPGATINELTLAAQVKRALSDYIDSIPMGGSIALYEFLSIAQKDLSIVEAYITSLTIDNKAVILKPEYRLEWDERAYVNNVITFR